MQNIPGAHMKLILSAILILILAGPVVYLPATILWLEAQRETIARDFCINRDEPELMCQGSCFINQAVTKAMESGPSGEIPPVPSQKKQVHFSALLPAGLLYPATPSESFHPQPCYRPLALFITPIHSIFRPPRLA